MMLCRNKIVLSLITCLLLLFFSRGNAMAQGPSAQFDANDTIVCVNNVISFTDLSVAGSSAITNWNWSFGDGGTDTQQNPIYSYTVGGNYIVKLVVTDLNGNKDSITHTIYVLTAQVINHTIHICSPQNTATILAIDPNITGVTGQWFTASTAVIASPNNDTSLVTNLISGTYLIFWVVSDGTCSAADQVTIIVDQPVIANANVDQHICTSTGTATLAGNNPAPGTGLWTTTSTATITNPSNRNTTVTGLSSVGTYTFIWTITNGSCSSNDTMKIFVTSPVANNAGVDQQVCASSPTTTLTGSNPSPGTGLWTTTGTSTIVSPSSATTVVNNLAAGTNTFIWTITNGACITRDTVLVIVTAQISANAGVDQQVCTSTGTATLNGNNPSPGTGLWTTTSTATITNPTLFNSGVTGLTTAGTYNFVWTITNGACVNRDTMKIIVNAPIVSNAGADQTFCNSKTATLTGNNPSPGTGLWTTTGSSTIATPTSATTTVSNLAIGNNNFIYTITFGACVSRDTVVIHVDSLLAANAGPDQQICETQLSVTMAGNNPSPGTGLWTALSGGTITTPTSATTTITSLTPGTHSFVWTITNGTCTSKDTMNVVVNVQVASNAGFDDEICQGTTASLSANNPAPATGLWTTTSSATIVSPTNPNTNVNGLTNTGIYAFVWSVTNGACVLRDTVRITVDSLIVSHAGPDQHLCNATTATLAGNSAGIGTGVWTTTGSATITNPSSPTSTVSNLVAGNNLFIWTITNGSCTSADTINIIVSNLIVSHAGADQSVCAGTLVTMSANNPSPGTGLWTALNGGTITTPTSATTTISNLITAGVYNFVWTITNGSCTSKDTVAITVTTNVIANAGVDQQLCNVTTATLNGSNPSPGTGLWSTTGSATITNPSSPTSTVSNLVAGNNLFIWTITNGACITKDTVNIIVSNLIVANAGADQSVCAGTLVTMSANNPSPGTGLWTALNGGTITTPTSATTTVSGLVAAGIYNFVWTITNGSCTSKDTVAITVSTNVIANAGADQQLCNVTTATLNGSNPSPGTGLWSTTGSATITNPTSANSGVTNLIIGNNLFIWTITNGACITKDTVNIIVSNLIVANAGADQSVCAGTLVTMSANNPSPGTGLWTALNGGTITTPTSATTTISNLITAGVYNFVWTITNGSCTSKDTVAITVTTNVIANAGQDQQLCNITTATLNGSNPSPGTGLWTTTGSATITTPTSANSGVTNLIFGNNLFIWTITNGACITKDTVNIIVSNLIVANAGADQSVCAGTLVTMSANNPSPGTGLWTALNGGTITTPTSATTTISNLITAGVYNFVWTITNGSCTSKDTVAITVTTNVIANAGADQQLCNVTTATLNGSNPSPGTGLWSTTGSATITTSGSPTSTVNNLIAGNNLFIWTITNGACITKDTVNIIVSNLIVANAGADQSVCAGTLATMSANNPSPGTGLWTALNGGTITTPTSATTTISNLITAGVYNFVWTITNGSCTSKDTVAITVTTNVIANAGQDQQLCNVTTATLNGSNPSPGTGLWSTTGTATITNPTSANSGVTNLIVGSNLFIWTITNGACITKDTVNIIVSNLIVSNAGADQSVCAGTLVTMSANNPSPGTGLWTALNGGTITTPTSATTTISNLITAGVYNFVWTITNGSCTSKDTVAITVTTNVIANAGADQQLCNVTTATLSGSNPSPGIGLWSTTGTATITTPASPTSTVSNLIPGNNLFIWTITNGACITKDTVNIIVSNLIVSNAGADQSVCAGTLVTMSANNPAPGTGLWTALNGGTITTPTSATTTISNLITAGVYNFIWTITNGSCTSKDTVAITVTTNVIANAGADQQLCNVTTATLAGSNPSPGTGLWSTTGSATITTPTSANSGVTNLVVGNNLFIWTITNGACITKDTVNIIISNLIVSNAGADQSVCAGTLVTMSANNPSPGTGLWTALNGGTITTPTSATTTISNLITAGVYNFVWTITNGSCTSKDTVAITVTTNVIANAGADQQLCNVTTATLSGSNPSPGTGLWSTTGSATITTPTSANSGVTNLVVGNNLFIWTITNGACITKDTVNIIVSNLIVSNAGADQSVCAGTLVTMSANNPSPGTGLWTALNGGTITTPTSATTTISNLITAGVYNFVWTITNGSCINSDTIAITVDSNVVANAGPDQQLCETQTSTTLAAIPVGVGSGSWSTTSTAIITNPTDPFSTVTNLTIGVYQFVWTVTNNTCQTSDTVTITVYQIPTTANAGSDQQICATASGITINGNAPTLGTGLWSGVGSAIVTTPTSPTSSVSNLQVGNNLFIWTITNGACISSDTVNILVDSNVVADAGADQQICETQTTATLSAAPVTVGAGIWSTTSTAVITNPTDPSSTVTNLAVGGYQFIWTVTNNTCQTTDTMTITVSQLGTTADAGIDQHFCASAASGISLNGNAPTLGNGIWSSLGSATVDTPTSPTSTVSNLIVGQNIFVWTITNGACISTDTTVVNITANPVANAGSDQFVTSLTPVIIGGSPSASLGTPPYSYQWIPGFGLDDSLIANPTATVNFTQQYILIITDSLGCQGTDTMVIYINNPPVAINDSAVICSNDSAIINILTNDFDPDSNAITATIIQNPLHGTFTLNAGQQLIYHANNGFNGVDSIQYQICDNGIPSLCDSAWVLITVHVSPTVTAVSTNSKCFGDSIGTINISPVGNAPYNFNWSNSQTTQNLDSLPAGIYTVLITDTFGCVVSLIDTITGPASALTATISHQPVLCYGDSTGAIDLQPTGGTIPYSYLWNTSATTQDLNNLLAGIYSVAITDTNGCVYTLLDTIVQPASALSATYLATNNKCPGDTTASITVTVSGGTTNYSYLWNNNATTTAINSLISGIYTLTITDQHFCVISITDTVKTLSPPILLNAVSVAPYCLGGTLGSVQLNPVGGIIPLHYLWSNNDTTTGIFNLVAGTYSVIVNDSLGCIARDTAQLTDSSNIVLTNSGSNSICIGDSVILSVPFYANVHYQWSLNGNATADTTTQIIVNQSGNYSITATAMCGNYSAGPLTITVNPLPSVAVSGDATITCDSVFTISASGGNTYSWSPANLCTTPFASSTEVNPQTSTVFTVVVTDANGCSAMDTVSLSVICDSLFIPTGFSPNGDGVNDLFVITHLSHYPNAVLQIFNRWGNLVYKKEHYDNSWNGLSNVNLSALGSELPDGTYYVIFDPNNGEKSHAGYVILRR